jgi:hypothetical protein
MVQTECGYQWTHKLEGMFKDIQLSKDLLPGFNGLVKSESEKYDVELLVNVCTTGYWPISQNVSGTLPQQLAPICDLFKHYYLGQHSGRRLEWRVNKVHHAPAWMRLSLIRNAPTHSSYDGCASPGPSGCLCCILAASEQGAPGDNLPGEYEQSLDTPYSCPALTLGFLLLVFQR